MKIIKLRILSKFVILSLLLTIFSIFKNIQFTPWPEMFLWPYLIIHGWMPYRDIAIIHTPLLPVILSLIFSLIGIGLIQLKIIAWTVLMATGLLLYHLATRNYTSKNAFLVLTVWFLLVIRYQGNTLWFESLLTPLILLLYIFIAQRKQYLISGIIFALALLTKQTVVWFAIPIGIIFFLDRNIKQIRNFIFGFLTIILPFFITLYFLNLLPDFLFWSVKFGIFQMPFMAGHVKASPGQLFVGLWPFLIIILVPFVKNRLRFISYLSWAIAGIMGIFPRWELFHFLPGLPFMALMIYHGLSKIKVKSLLIRLFCILYIGGSIIIVIRSLVFNWGVTDRFFEPEISQTIDYVKKNTLPSDTIFILNTWDSIYALADRQPASRPWIPGLSWYTQLPGVQSGVVRSLEAAPPRLVVYKEHDLKGLGSYRADIIEKYIFAHYSKFKSFGGGYWIMTTGNYLSYE